jgi:hypothetical protein
MLPERAIVRSIPDTETKPESKQLPVRSTTDRGAPQGGMDHSHVFASRQNAPLNFDQQRQALSGDPRYLAVTMAHC